MLLRKTLSICLRSVTDFHSRCQKLESVGLNLTIRKSGIIYESIPFKNLWENWGFGATG